MAWTISHITDAKFSLGNLIGKIIRVSPDSASEVVTSGYQHVHFVFCSPQSAHTANSGGAKIRFNVNTLGVASEGSIAITGVNSGDVLQLFVVGY